MHNYESGDTVLLTISRQDKKLELPLYSHYTCIQGKSGSGKTHFLSYLNDHLSDGILIIENTLNAEVAVALDANTLSYLLRLPERMIIFADEASITHDSMLFSSINKSSHLLVIVCRADCFSVATSLQGLWSLEDTADWFKLQRMPELPICSKICDQLATESASNKSEHLILSQFFSNIIPLSSSGNIASFIENCETDVLIFL